MDVSIVRTKSFVTDATKLLMENALYSLKKNGRFILGLSGGKTPIPVYEEFAIQGKFLDWKNIFVTFSDERCVVQDHTESNYRMAYESLLSKVGIPKENIFRI